ncbi:MAG TPA: hypothetical protein VN132_07845 [Bdellovibrio sp.]|nr:hypothetical protein [Bdellovibrio sp.]
MFKKALLVLLSCSCLVIQAEAAVLDQEAQVMSLGDAKSNNFSVTFFSIASVANMRPGQSEPKSNRMVDSYDYFSLNYRIDADSKASLRIPVLFNSEGVNQYGDDKPSTVSLNDIHFVYSNYDLGYIGDVDFSGNAKWYLPTSPYSQAAKTIAKFRFEGYFTWQFARYSSIEYVVKPDIYWQSQTAFFNPDGIPQYDDGTYMRDPRSSTKQFALEHYVQANLDIDKYFTFLMKAGFNEDWYHASAAEDLEGDHVTKFRAGIGVEIRPMRGLNFTVQMQNDTTLNSYRGKDIAFFQPENTEYSLMTNAFVF